MFELTDAAAEQVKTAAKEGGAEGLALRLAAQRQADGSIDYVMGFDEIKPEDIRVECKGVEIAVAPEYAPLLNEASMDYVELEAGKFRFIFLNPNDDTYIPPEEKR